MPVSDGVPALVASVREHKRFKQLAIYSIECVSKVRPSCVLLRAFGSLFAVF